MSISIIDQLMTVDYQYVKCAVLGITVFIGKYLIDRDAIVQCDHSDECGRLPNDPACVGCAAHSAIQTTIEVSK